MCKHLLLYTLLLLVIYHVISQITIFRRITTIYDSTTNLTIKGSGFNSLRDDILINITSNSRHNILQNEDFIVTNSDYNNIVLTLINNSSWVDLSTTTPPIALILTSIIFKTQSLINQLPEPFIVAQVLSTPSIDVNFDVIYCSYTNELKINGSGLIGARRVVLNFNPTLLNGVSYDVYSRLPLSVNQIVLRLRKGYKWRNEPGLLNVTSIDTGGGVVQLNGDQGIIVAEVLDDSYINGVVIESTASSQYVFLDDLFITIKGDNFNILGNTLRFSNGILGHGVDYNTISTSSTEIKLQLTNGSKWLRTLPNDNLPAPLSIIAVNSGYGFVYVGSNVLKKGVDIATVFARPVVSPQSLTIHPDSPKTISIHGSGFAVNYIHPSLVFNIIIAEGIDYTTRVIDNTNIELTLIEGRTWSNKSNIFQLSSINTRGDVNGWIHYFPAVHIADIIDTTSTPFIQVFPSAQLVYQSCNQQNIIITGIGFVRNMSFVFDSGLTEGVDYDWDFDDYTKIILKLRTGMKWLDDAGIISLLSIAVNDNYIILNENVGIRVATVLLNPVIFSSDRLYRNSQSKILSVKGSGFTYATACKVSLKPTEPSYYIILRITNKDIIEIKLSPYRTWLPSVISLDNDNIRIPLQVVSIDTGAGVVIFLEPITVGYIIQDKEGVVCDDSCEFSFDGICDDGTLSSSYASFTSNNSYTNNYDDYYQPDNSYSVSACVEGTDCTDCGGIDKVAIFPNSTNIYQSRLHQPIFIYGTGLETNLSISLEPSLNIGIDYQLEFINSSLAKISLIGSNSKWRETPGPLKIIYFKLNELIYSSRTGIRIANIIADPAINSSNHIYYQSLSKAIAISGKGFANVWNFQLTFSNINADSFRISSILEDVITLQLKPGYTWSNTLTDLIEKLPIQVLSINTGAGTITYNEPITIGYIENDYNNKSMLSCNHQLRSVCSISSEQALTLSSSIKCIIRNFNKLEGQCSNMINYLLLNLYTKCDKDLHDMCGHVVKNPIRTLECIHSNIYQVSPLCRYKWYSLEKGNGVPCDASSDYYCTDVDDVEDIPMCLSLTDSEYLSSSCYNTISDYQQCLILNPDSYYDDVSYDSPCWMYESTSDDDTVSINRNPNNDSNNNNIAVSLQVLVGLIITLILLIVILLISIYIRYRQSTNKPNRQLYLPASTNESTGDAIVEDGVYIQTNKKRKNIFMLNMKSIRKQVVDGSNE